jgi:hypothetical protein
LCRIAATQYDESISSLLYPGNILSQQVLRDAIWKFEQVMQITWQHRPQTLVRLDGGFGTDDNLGWLLQQGYQLCAKGFSGKRAGAWGRDIQDWLELSPGNRWAAVSPHQLTFCQPTRTIAVRWRTEDGPLKHALYIVTDLTSPIPIICEQYGLRGQVEVDIRNDKQGLLLTHRRKRRWNAQETILLLNDLAHNWLTTFRQVALRETPLQNFGIYRLIHEALNIPGQAIIEDGRLLELRLMETHPHAQTMAKALCSFWQSI